MMAAELNPAPDETISLAEQVEELRQECQQLKLDLEALSNNQVTIFRLIKELKEGEREEKLGKTVLLRCQKVIRYINNRPDHKATLETLKGVLQVDDAKMSQVISALNKGWPGRFITRPIGGNGRKKELVQVKK
jgi:hypothetical protein